MICGDATKLLSLTDGEIISTRDGLQSQIGPTKHHVRVLWLYSDIENC